jgi:broad specificity phosphatase PhoE
MNDSFPEEDEMVRNGTKETYEDVRARIQRTLINIYDTDSAKVIHLFLHNRCFHSFLSMIGHSEEEEFDLQNCATLVFLVTRERLNQEQAAEQQRRHEMAKVKEEAAIRKAKAELSAAAQKLVREMDGKQASEVYGELTSDEDRMKWDSWRR